MIKISTCTGSEDCLYPHTEIEKPVGVQERAPTHRLNIMLIKKLFFLPIEVVAVKVVVVEVAVVVIQ